MTLRKIGSLLLGALLVVGLSSAVSAQTILEDGDGVRIRVTNQNSGEFVGIGDSIVVEVQYLTTIAPTDIRVAIVKDTIDVVAMDFMNTSFDDEDTRFGEANEFFKRATTAGDGVDLLLDTTIEGHHVESVDGAASFSKVVFTFHVMASSSASSSTATLAIMVVVRNVDADEGSLFNNLRVDVPTIATDLNGTSFGFEGDGVVFAIDSNRPTGAISNVFIDANEGKSSQIWKWGVISPIKSFTMLATTIANVDLASAENGRLETDVLDTDVNGPVYPGDPVVAFSDGDNLTVSFKVENPPSGATGIIYIVDPSDLIVGEEPATAVADSAIFTFTFTFAELLGGTVRDSITVSQDLVNLLDEDDLDQKYVGNNRRITAAAFLRDRAGNLSAVRASDSDTDQESAENSLTPEASKDPNIYVLDLTTPTVTPVRPRTVAAKAAGELPDSTRFTALTETDLDIIPLTNGTTLASKTIGLNPFELMVDEGLVEIQVTLVTDAGDEVSLSTTGTDNGARVGGDKLENPVIPVAMVDVDGVMVPATLNPADIAATDKEGGGDDGEMTDGVPDAAVAFDLSAMVFGKEDDPSKMEEPPGPLERVTDAQEGHGGTWVVTVTDSSGNVTNDEQTGIWFDGVAPSTVIAGYFPTEKGAPTDPNNFDKPTITSATAHPVIELSEKLDSLGVQYVQKTAISPVTSVVRVPPGDVALAQTGTPFTITLSDSLESGNEYVLQIFQRDLSGNVSMTSAQTLTYDDDFPNPEADQFKLSVDNVDVVAGQTMTITVTALDSGLSETADADIIAVTHSKEAVLRIEEVAAAKKLAGLLVTFDGDGVTDNEDGTATLDAENWYLGTRDVEIVSKGIIESFIVVVEEVTGTDVNFGEEIEDTLSVEAADFRAFAVKVMEDGVETDVVSGDFTVWVQPTDEFGNPSAKVITDVDPEDGMNVKDVDLLKLLAANIDSENVLSETFVEFSTNIGDVQVPEGPQAVAEGGTSFHPVAPDRGGEGLVISVRAFNAEGDSRIVDEDFTERFRLAAGTSGSLTFTPFGEAPPRPPSTDLEAPDALIVQDYMGADGAGDQGGFVIVSYSAVEGATRYRLYREISVSTGLDENGDLATIDPPVDMMVPWAAFDPAADDDGIGRNVVPTLDNAATNWAIAAERGGSSSGQTAASKRVFTKQLVQNMVTFLNVDPNRVLSTEELGKVFAPSEDYVKSIIGDQKNVQFAALDVDFTALLGGASTVPQSIRTQTSQIQSSARTATEEPVKAVDNLPPAAVEGAGGTFDGANVSLAWQVSSDDRVVGSMSYLGYSIPIAGVDRYEVWRGESADALELYATLSAGETTFVDQEVPGVSSVIYRIDAADLDNMTPGTAVTVELLTERVPFATADGAPVYIILINGETPFTQDFEDFLAFAEAFQKSAGEPGFLLQADTNDDGAVDFTDFLAFTSSFLGEAVAPAGAKFVYTPQLPGVNDNVELALSLSDSKVLAGQMVTVNVALANATALTGFGFELLYDADNFEYVESAAAEQDLLKSGGAETPLFLAHPGEAGQLVIANAVIDGAPVSGNGEVVSLTFKVLQEFEDNARFELADGVVFDHESLSNPVVALGSLSVESTPTEFALLQNFPNPFNPETTIKYNLAEGTNVSLRIYNVVGQVVRTLVAEQQSAGRYTVRWNGSDDRGVSVSSGIYFYELRSQGFQDVKKLMLLK